MYQYFVIIMLFLLQDVSIFMNSFMLFLLQGVSIFVNSIMAEVDNMYSNQRHIMLGLSFNNN